MINRYDMIIFVRRISFTIPYDNFVWENIIRAIFALKHQYFQECWNFVLIKWFFSFEISLSFSIQYDNFVWENIITDMIWYLSANIYHRWYDMIFLRKYLSSTIQYDNFPGEKYHQWYDMIFFSKYLSSMIRYDIFEGIFIINDTIW